MSPLELDFDLSELVVELLEQLGRGCWGCQQAHLPDELELPDEAEPSEVEEQTDEVRSTWGDRWLRPGAHLRESSWAELFLMAPI